MRNLTGIPARLASTLALALAPLLFVPGAAADVVLPSGNFTCGLYSPPFFGSSLLQGCTGSASSFSSPGVPGVQGVSLGMSAPVTWTVAGSQTGDPNSEVAIPNPTGTENSAADVTMTTEGIVGGTGAFSGSLPLHYDFTIAAVGSPSCLSTMPCDIDLNWNLFMYITGPAVSNPDGVFSVLVSGSGAGRVLGRRHLSAPAGRRRLGGPVGPTLSTTITSGLEATVYSDLRLNAYFASDAVGSFSLYVPQGSSFDFESGGQCAGARRGGLVRRSFAAGAPVAQLQEDALGPSPCRQGHPAIPSIGSESMTRRELLAANRRGRGHASPSRRGGAHRTGLYCPVRHVRRRRHRKTQRDVRSIGRRRAPGTEQNRHHQSEHDRAAYHATA